MLGAPHLAAALQVDSETAVLEAARSNRASTAEQCKVELRQRLLATAPGEKGEALVRRFEQFWYESTVIVPGMT